MKIGILFHAEQAGSACAQSLCDAVRGMGASCVVFSHAEDVCDVDRLIVLGGDGTILRAARRSSELAIPLVGVNYGTLGFLTEFERGEDLLAAGLALDPDCETIRRTMLEVELNGEKTHCLNEIAMMRGLSCEKQDKIARFSVSIDGSSAGDFAADGLIVATPTGSTAYSLSAGGNIMTPDCETFLLTPVCAFSMRSRPIAYCDRSTLSIHVPDCAQAPFALYGDGKFLGQVSGKDTLLVRKSKRFATFMTWDKGGFFRRITQKIN